MYQTKGDALRSGAPVAQVREQQLSEAVVRLQRGLLRLLFAFHGRSPEIDSRLKKLGNLVRSGQQRTNELNQLVDEAINCVVPLASANQSNRVGDTMFRLLGRLEPALVSAEELRELRTRASALDDLAIDDFIRDCAGFLNRIGETSAKATSAGDAKENFRHLFESLTAPSALAPQLKVLQNRFVQASSQTEILNLVEQLARMLEGAFAQPVVAVADHSMLPAFTDLLLGMLDRMSVPDSARDRAERIRKTLTTASTLVDLRSALSALVDLIEYMKAQLQAEIRQLTGFLEQLVRRLNDIDVHVGIARALHTSSMADSKILNGTIGQHLVEIRLGIDGVTDIAMLKSRIDDRLNQINSSLSAYMAQEDKRFIEAKGALDALTNEIRDLESTTTRLRSDLEVEHERAMLDVLTGIPNRLGYEARIESDYARWHRHGGSLSLAVIDVDNFKQINDSYGHAAGDKVLTTIAIRLQEHLRASDHLSRFGGEEFLLILPETGLRDAEAVVDKLRTMIAKCRFHYKTMPVSITVSCGVAEFQEGDSIQQVFDRADEAMFLAKRRGRNLCLTERECSETAAAG
ncbi:MAG: GGDEF domain-containing protein [Gammaproteobacteria bacterium]|nr:GGDEF domain-containing protein [Gammaproteobacteria bacterium]